MLAPPSSSALKDSSLLESFPSASFQNFNLLILLFLSTFFLFLSTRLGDDLSIRHVKRIVLQSSGSLSHRTTTECCDQLSKWIGFPFFFLVFFLLLLRVFKRLLNELEFTFMIFLKWMSTNSQSNPRSLFLVQHSLLAAKVRNKFWQRYCKLDVCKNQKFK